ncbi:MAG: His-Xaa-Ser system radical SAM maturase HxsC [Alphaproteobacteria bacterium]|nr:MAG: His-Xaa-Ser system radical SAM maturase HxsC [Alphaproteobacteria bacterium]
MIKLHSNKNIITSSSDAPLILKITKKYDLPKILRSKRALLVDSVTDINAYDGFDMVISRNKLDSKVHNVAYLSDDLNYLDEGDIVRVTPNSSDIRVLYRVNASANFLFVTERCNSFCIMCSQPPRDVNDGHLVEELIEAVSLIDIGERELGITGGEPTLLGDRFFALLQAIKSNLPTTSIHVLTNGRTFADPLLAKQISEIDHYDLMLGIPLYSDVSHIHDFVVQADGAFDETIRGILNLKRHSQKVEIRVVLHKQTYDRLPQLAEFIGRNLQFVDHVALMGLEITGFTRANLEELWIDPLEYMDKLSEAVEILARFKIHTSIYNLQRCLLPRHLWGIAVKSISDWKNKYYEECDNCAEKHNCGGFFASSDIKRSDNIAAIK